MDRRLLEVTCKQCGMILYANFTPAERTLVRFVSPGREAGGGLKLAELVLALNDWIVAGGFLPAAWSKK